MRLRDLFAYAFWGLVLLAGMFLACALAGPPLGQPGGGAW